MLNEDSLFNCMGLVSTHKKSLLKHLVTRLSPDVIFLQENLGSSDSVKDMLYYLLPGWVFLVLDARGRSGGLATGWRSVSCQISNSWG